MDPIAPALLGFMHGHVSPAHEVQRVGMSVVDCYPEPAVADNFSLLSSYSSAERFDPFAMRATALDALFSELVSRARVPSD